MSYDTDYYSWTQQQAAALRRLAADRPNVGGDVDWEHVAEEIESLGRAEAHALRSSYRLILMHLLKWQHQPERRSDSWRHTIVRERLNVEESLEDNPGLKPRQDELYDKAYRLARKEAAAETGLPLATFPEECPYPREDAVREEFWPD